jgi:hypothetical protein
MKQTFELFATSTCTRCPELEKYLKYIRIKVVKRVIDKDPEAETDAIMLGIRSAPALRLGDLVLPSKEIFGPNGEFYQKNVFKFTVTDRVMD